MSKTICNECKKPFTELMRCDLDGVTEHLCNDCLKDSGYCYGCGKFWAGVDSFENSEIPNFCEHCVDDIKSTMGEELFESPFANEGDE